MKDSLKNKYITNKYIVFSAVLLIMCLAAYSPLALRGKSIIWNTDSLGQYYPTFLYIGKYLRDFLTGIFHGQLILPTFDLSIGMGEDIVGTLNYYGFGDPINIIAIFANADNGSRAFAAAYFLRLILAGYAFIYYCEKIRISGMSAVLGATLWTFSGFVLDGCLRYSEWLSVLIYFPLMLAGVEIIISGRKSHKLFVFSVLYAALCGFYFLYMSSLALVVYCIARYISVNGLKNVKEWVMSCFKLVPDYILGIMFSAPILLPAMKAYLGSERNSAERAFAYVTNYIPHPQLLFGFIKNSIIPSYYINYAMGIVIAEWIVVALLFFRPNSKRNVQLKIAVLISLLAASLPITGYFFNGFGETNERWMYLIHFAFIISFIEMLDKNVLVGKGKNAVFIKNGVILLTLINILGNSLYVLSPVGDNWSADFIDLGKVASYTKSPYELSETIMGDKELFRISNDMITDVNGRPENIAMLNDYYGLTYWFSIVNSNTQRYVDEVCGEEMIWRSYGFDNDTEAESLSGCKYYLSRADYSGIEDHEKSIPDEYEKIESVTFDGTKWDIYRNPGYMGLIYSEKMIDNLDTNNEGFSVEQIHYNKSKNRIGCIANFNENTNLIASIPYSNNWRAYVDGNEVDIEPYKMFAKINMPSGSHEVEFRYCNLAYRIGLIIMLVASLICAVTYYVSRPTLNL